MHLVRSVPILKLSEAAESCIFPQLNGRMVCRDNVGDCDNPLRNKNTGTLTNCCTE